MKKVLAYFFQCFMNFMGYQYNIGIHFKILILTFKAMHGLAPKYVIELINIKPRSIFIYNLGSYHSLLLDPRKGKMLFTLIR